MPSLLNFFGLVLFCSSYIHADTQPSQKARSIRRDWLLPFDRRYQIPVQTIYPDEIGNNYIYTNCDELRDEDNILCNVTKETYFNTVRSTTCIEFEVSPKNNKTSLEYYHFWSETLDRVIFYAFEKNRKGDQWAQIRLRILNFHDCNFNETIIPVDEANGSIENKAEGLLTTNSTIELILWNSEVEGVRHGTPWSRLSFDREGRSLGVYPIDMKEKVYNIPAISHQSGDKGYYAVRTDSIQHIMVSYIYKNGSTIELRDDGNPEQYQGKIAVSSAHEIFSVCWLHDKTRKPDFISQQYGTQSISCLQAREKIPNKPEIALEINWESPLNITKHWVGVHSWKEGGFLLVTGHCDEIQNHKRMDCKSFDVISIDSKGGKKSLMESKQLDLICNDPVWKLDAQIRESEDELCFHFHCQDGEMERYYTGTYTQRYYKKCFGFKTKYVK